MQTAKRGAPNLFVTLTVPPHKYDSFDEQARDMRRGLVLLRRQIHKRWRVENIPFIVVFERHKSGAPHMHLLMRGPFMLQRILLAIWRNIMGSGGVNIKFIRNQQKVLFYITKYIGKDLAKFEGCKRYWRSQNYEVEKTEREQIKLYSTGYRLERGSIDYLRLRLAEDGFLIKKIDADKFHYRSQRDYFLAQNYRMPWHDNRVLKPSFMTMAGP
ncbi:MAG: rolling circle replication-associated protein [Beijerinckiaceae bacterium]